jgi:nucleoside-diphosphate-sugar epimerase
MKVLVTGANGFIGTALVAELQAQGDVAVGAVRSIRRDNANDFVAVGEVNAHTDWTVVLDEVEVVVHLAARAHLVGKEQASTSDQFHETNVLGAVALAKQAIAAKVKRFIFISSIGVNGPISSHEGFTEITTPAPKAAYAVSKFQAEQELITLFSTVAAELVIIRPPLVYAAHAPGNFGTLLRVIDAGAPLPFLSVRNSRTMVSLNNLVDFITLCIKHPAAAGEIFLVGDKERLSTPEIFSLIAKGMGRRSRLFRLPSRVLSKVFGLIGRKNMHVQLCESLVINSEKATAVLGWVPKETTQMAMVSAARVYHESLTKKIDRVK